MTNSIKGGVLCVALFLFGLYVPKMVLVITFIMVLVAFKIISTKSLPYSFVFKFILLFAFAMSYYLLIALQGIHDFQSGINSAQTIILMYCAGFLLNDDLDSGDLFHSLWPILSLIGGFVVFTFLTVRTNYTLSDVFLGEYSKAIPSFWGGGDPINRPGLGAMASLGMCLAPVLLLGKANIPGKGGAYIFRTAIFILLGMGLYINLILANRSPFLALGTALLISLVIILIKNKQLAIELMLKILVIALLAIYILSIYFDFSDLYAIQRFMDEGLDTAGRFVSWQIMLSELFTSPFGGRVVFLGGNSFVHNMWLDVDWDAGIIPFVFLLAFHLIHLKDYKVLFWSKVPLFFLIFIACASTSFFMNFLQEPTMEASPAYFAASCFLLGAISKFTMHMERGGAGAPYRGGTGQGDHPI